MLCKELLVPTELPPANPAYQPLQVTIRPQQAFWSGDGPTFQDMLDTLNPLQHIPVVSNLYRAISGETTSTGARLAGDALFGGPIGFIASLLDTIIESGTGSSFAGNIVAAVEGRPVPALHNNPGSEGAGAEPVFMSANQRANYNAYVRASRLS
jgi:hypothetical protein